MTAESLKTITNWGLTIVVFLLMVLIAKMADMIKDGKIKRKPLYKYNKEKYLLTKVEDEFYKKLVSLFGEKYYIFPQIHLSSILDHKVVG